MYSIGLCVLRQSWFKAKLEQTKSLEPGCLACFQICFAIVCSVPPSFISLAWVTGSDSTAPVTQTQHILSLSQSLGPGMMLISLEGGHHPPAHPTVGLLGNRAEAPSWPRSLVNRCPSSGETTAFTAVTGESPGLLTVSSLLF